MATEIERKFLVTGNEWRSEATGQYLQQGYISTQPERTVRVRIVANTAYLAIKGKSRGASRLEFEYEIPIADARELMQLCEHLPLEKTRYRLEVDGLIWEIDVFEGQNQGLILAEVEVNYLDQPLRLPSWVGQEVTGDPRYFNSYLVQHPFTTWESL
ncbi:MAG: CYTH domain-containing protein [Gemmatimonadetes bacterium]|nr:MAG: CYTH domain-containing protein [Gemmatimonadota bacterium]